MANNAAMYTTADAGTTTTVPYSASASLTSAPQKVRVVIGGATGTAFSFEMIENDDAMSVVETGDSPQSKLLNTLSQPTLVLSTSVTLKRCRTTTFDRGTVLSQMITRICESYLGGESATDVLRMLTLVSAVSPAWNAATRAVTQFGRVPSIFGGWSGGDKHDPLSSFRVLALLARCPKLTALDMFGIDKLAAPTIKTIIRAVPHLRSLELPTTKPWTKSSSLILCGPWPFPAALRTLDLSHARSMDVGVVSSFPAQLEVLRLGSREHTSSWWQGTPGLLNTALQEFANRCSMHLRKLELAHCPIASIDLSVMTRLQTLKCYAATRLTMITWPPARASELARVALSGTSKLSDASILRLARTATRNLAKLDLTDVQVSDQLLKTLKTAPQLSKLSLGPATVDDACWQRATCEGSRVALSALAQLSSLQITHSPFTQPLPSYHAGLTEVVLISARKVRMLEAKFGSLTSLHVIRCQSCHTVTVDAPRLAQLKVIDCGLKTLALLPSTELYTSLNLLMLTSILLDPQDAYAFFEFPELEHLELTHWTNVMMIDLCGRRISPTLSYLCLSECSNLASFTAEFPGEISLNFDSCPLQHLDITSPDLQECDLNSFAHTLEVLKIRSERFRRLDQSSSSLSCLDLKQLRFDNVTFDPPLRLPRMTHEALETWSSSTVVVSTARSCNAPAATQPSSGALPGICELRTSLRQFIDVTVVTDTNMLGAAATNSFDNWRHEAQLRVCKNTTLLQFGALLERALPHLPQALQRVWCVDDSGLPSGRLRSEDISSHATLAPLRVYVERLGTIGPNMTSPEESPEELEHDAVLLFCWFTLVDDDPSKLPKTGTNDDGAMCILGSHPLVDTPKASYFCGRWVPHDTGETKCGVCRSGRLSSQCASCGRFQATFGSRLRFVGHIVVRPKMTLSEVSIQMRSLVTGLATDAELLVARKTSDAKPNSSNADDLDNASNPAWAKLGDASKTISEAGLRCGDIVQVAASPPKLILQAGGQGHLPNPPPKEECTLLQLSLGGSKLSRDELLMLRSWIGSKSGVHLQGLGSNNLDLVGMTQIRVLQLTLLEKVRLSACPALERLSLHFPEPSDSAEYHCGPMEVVVESCPELRTVTLSGCASGKIVSEWSGEVDDRRVLSLLKIERCGKLAAVTRGDAPSETRSMALPWQRLDVHALHLKSLPLLHSCDAADEIAVVSLSIIDAPNLTEFAFITTDAVADGCLREPDKDWKNWKIEAKRCGLEFLVVSNSLYKLGGLSSGEGPLHLIVEDMPRLQSLTIAATLNSCNVADCPQLSKMNIECARAGDDDPSFVVTNCPLLESLEIPYCAAHVNLSDLCSLTELTVSREDFCFQKMTLQHCHALAALALGISVHAHSKVKAAESTAGGMTTDTILFHRQEKFDHKMALQRSTVTKSDWQFVESLVVESCGSLVTIDGPFASLMLKGSMPALRSIAAVIEDIGTNHDFLQGRGLRFTGDNCPHLEKLVVSGISPVQHYIHPDEMQLDLSHFPRCSDVSLHHTNISEIDARGHPSLARLSVMSDRVLMRVDVRECRNLFELEAELPGSAALDVGDDCSLLAHGTPTQVLAPFSAVKAGRIATSFALAYARAKKL